MKTYTPDSTLTFGKNKGYSLRKIYQFEPSYISWMIEYTSYFYIDISEFEILPKPTPYFKNYPNSNGGNGFIPDDSHVFYALEYLSSGGIIPEVDFKFEDKLIKILDMKRDNSYQPPDYTTINKAKKLGPDDLL